MAAHEPIKKMTAAIFMCLIAAMLPCTVQAAQHTPSPYALFSADPGKKLFDPDDPVNGAVIRNRPVQVNFELLDRAADADLHMLQFNLFYDETLAGAVTKRIIRSPHSYSLAGCISGDNGSSFMLSINGDIALGNIRLSDGTHYQIGYAPGGTHYLREIDDSLFPVDHEPVPVIPDSMLLRAPPAASAPLDSGDIFDVLVVYTAAAKDAQGGELAIETLINLAVDETNQAYENSGIQPRLNLVHQEEITYTEVDFSTDLTRLRGTDDGHMDSVHSLRNTHGADLVVLISDTEGACGIGYLMTALSDAFAASAFSVTRYSCATGNYTFGHELGHNMGCHHAVGDGTPAAEQGNGLYNFSHGWRFTAADDGGQYRTIMAYSPGTRIQYFSNPHVTYKGTPTGIPPDESDAAHNARSINQAALTVANWRDSVTTSTTTSVLPGEEIRDTPFLHGADLNSDGRTDLVYIDFKGYVHYTTNLRDWTAIGLNRFSIITSGDFQKDGTNNDIAGINLRGYALYSTDLTTWNKIGSNAFTELKSADFSGSGSHRDLAGINRNGYILYSDDLSSWEKIGANKFTSMITGDFSTSGRDKDIAAINMNGYILYTTDREQWEKIGANKFTALTAADLDGSGTKDDLTAVNLNRYILCSSDRQNWSRIGLNKFSSLAVGDFNGDGTEDDIAAINLNQYILYSKDRTSWNKIGSNRFTSTISGDFDADGTIDDLAAVNLAGHVLYSTDLSTWTKISRP
jgi:hypothetical protein